MKATKSWAASCGARWPRATVTVLLHHGYSWSDGLGRRLLVCGASPEELVWRGFVGGPWSKGLGRRGLVVGLGRRAWSEELGRKGSRGATAQVPAVSRVTPRSSEITRRIQCAVAAYAGGREKLCLQEFLHICVTATRCTDAVYGSTRSFPVSIGAAVFRGRRSVGGGRFKRGGRWRGGLAAEAWVTLGVRRQWSLLT